MLRLFAPEAPYTTLELNSIFNLFLSEIDQLGKPQDESSFQHYFYLLESLSTVKSVIIIADLDNAEELSTRFFNTCFNVVKTNPPRNVQVCMTELLVLVIDEVNSLSEDVVELILGQFQEGHSDHPSYQMALNLAHICIDGLQRRVCQFFSDALMTMSSSEGTQDDIEELRKVHKTIQQVYAIAPELLLNVVPQLEEEMKVDDYGVRLMATETIGGMLAEKQSNIYQKYPSAWKTWLGRRNDKAVQLRIKWVENCRAIFETHPQTVTVLNDCFKSKLSDPEERVRTAACRVIGELGIDDVIQNLDLSVLNEMALRCKDKKATVRKEAMAALGSFYNSAYYRIHENEQAVVEKLGWIPDNLLSCIYVDDRSVTVAVEKTLHECIFPNDTDEEERTKRLVLIVGTLSQRSKLAFIGLIRKQKGFMGVIAKYLDLLETEDNPMDIDGGASPSKVELLSKHIAALFPESARVLAALQKFSTLLTEKRDLLTIAKACANANSDYSQIVDNYNRLAERLTLENPGLFEILEPVLLRFSPFSINKSSVSHLFNMMRNQRTSRRTSTRNKHAIIIQEILTEISTLFPSMFDDNIHDLVLSTANQAGNESAKCILDILARLTMNGTKIGSPDQSVLDCLETYLRSRDITSARNAAIVLSHLDISDMHTNIIQNITNNLSVEYPQLAVSLASAAEFSRYQPALIAENIEKITDFIAVQLLPFKTKSVHDKTSEWEEYESLDEISKAKLSGIELLQNYLLASSASGVDEALVEKIFNILWEALGMTFDQATSKGLSAPEASRLRLVAANAIVTLTHQKEYEHYLSVVQFEHLGLTLQDTCYFVREGFAETLMAKIPNGQLHLRYYSMLFMIAHEPEEILLKRVAYFLRKNAAKLHNESKVMENSFVRLVHMLAHHPDFTVANTDLAISAQYIEFYLSCVATPENVSFLYHVAQKIKLSKDMVSNELSENSYYLSDLASLLIKRKCKEATWPLNVYPQNIRLQSKLYRALPTGAVQTETMKKNYLPDTFMAWLDENQNYKTSDKRTQAALPETTTKRTRLA
ncbi:armadillo-type protein [Dichotomocladium elegans]|nr:armadillo-type protein [Dichotomocladium elegans]